MRRCWEEASDANCSRSADRYADAIEANRGARSARRALDEAGRQELSLRETLVLLCEREIARKDERRIEMTLKLARFPFVRDLAGFDFAAQP